MSDKVFHGGRTMTLQECADAEEALMPSGATGPKYDQGKQRWLAMPLIHLRPLADAFTAGETKYSLFSNLHPFEQADRRFWDATMRHLELCQVDPLATDPETGCYHAAEACFSILMRLSNARRKADPELDRAFKNLEDQLRLPA